MRSGAPRPRDVDATGFTRTLDALMAGVDEALCAVFVDNLGETIDLSTRIDAFDARIAGAETAILLARWRGSTQALGHGPLLELRVAAGARSILARTVGMHCDLVLVTAAQGITAAAAERCAVAAAALRAEAGLAAPAGLSLLRAVELRPSDAGGTVPWAFVEDGVRRRVSAVLGVLKEAQGTAYLVRTAEGEELLVRHDRTQGRWHRA